MICLLTIGCCCCCCHLASLIVILRYQSSIPTIEHICSRIFNNSGHCFLDRTLPYLIIRFKTLWITVFTLISCCAFLIIFQWPQLQFDVCHLNFDTLPWIKSEKTSHNFDIDITYYMGSAWEIPSESFLPMDDIPKLEYTNEDRMSTKPEGVQTFLHTLKTNLTQLIQFCSSVQQQLSMRRRVSPNDQHYLPGLNHSFSRFDENQYRNNLDRNSLVLVY